MRVAALDVGGTFIKHCVIENGHMAQRGKVPTPRDSAGTLKGADGHEAFLGALADILNQAGSVDGMALSLPGVMDCDRKYLYAGGSLVYNNRQDVTEWERRLGVHIELENDARSSAAAELALGNMRSIRDGLVLTFGTGVGCGVIIDGKVHRGAHRIAGEVSVVWADNPAKGTKAFLGSIGGIGNLAREVGEACSCHVTTGEEAFELIAAGDETARAVFDARCDKMVRALFNFQCLLDPERICIGGGVSANPLFIEGLRAATRRYYDGFPIEFPHAELVSCRFRNAANLLGAYLHYLSATGHDALAAEIDVEGVC